MVYKNIVRFFKHIFGKKLKKPARKKKIYSKKRFSHRRKSLKKAKPLRKNIKKRLLRTSSAKRRKKVGKAKKKRGIEPVGEIMHYFPKVNAAVVKLKRPLYIGAPVRIKGRKTDFCQTVGSMQINRKAIEKAMAGEEIGLEVFKAVMPGDFIFLNSMD